MRLFIDIETAYNTAIKYDLKNISLVEYIRSPRFHIFGLSYCWENPQNDPQWVSGKDIFKWIDSITWSLVTLVGHNIKFDGFILKEKYGVQPKSWIDTKSMSRAVLGKSVKNHSLATLAEYFGLEPKGIMKTDGLKTLTPEQEKELADYCLHDVWLCREIYNRLALKFPESQYAPMNQTIEMFVTPKLQLNVSLLEKTAKEEAKRRETIFKDIGIDKKEFASNKKFPALLVSKGYEVPTKPSPKQKNEDGTSKQIPAIALGDTEFLELLESEDEQLRTLCEARVAAKSTLLETRSNKLAVIGSTGLWPFDVEFSGADQTHRFSGGNGAGGNPQNFTRDSALREAVEAPQGYSLCVGDFDKVECRIVAYLSKDPNLINDLKSDPYSAFASRFYGYPVTKSKETEKERKFGKAAILGLGYNMGSKKFQKKVRLDTGQSIDKDEAWAAVEFYRRRYPLVPALWQKFDQMIPRLKDHGFSICCDRTPTPGSITLPSGLEIKYTNLRSEMNDKGYAEWRYDAYSKGRLETRSLYGGKILENISQALAGELCKEAMFRMGNQVVGQCHDELLILCKKGTELLIMMKLKKAMTMAPSWFSALKLEAAIHSGQNWKEAK